MGWLGPGLAVLVLCACPKQVDETVVVANPQPTAAAVEPGSTRSAPEGPQPSASSRYAESPITPLADQATDLVIAALSGEPLPDGIPTEPIDPKRLVVGPRDGPPPRASDLEFIGCGLEFEVSYDASGKTALAEPTLEVVVLVTRAGMKVISARLRPTVQGAELPDWLRGVGLAATRVVEIARRGELANHLIGEPERSLFGSRYEDLLREGPNDRQQRKIRDFASAVGDPQGYRVDEVVVIAKHRGGALYVFKLDVDEHRGQIVLDSRPLVQIRNLEHR